MHCQGIGVLRPKVPAVATERCPTHLVLEYTYPAYERQRWNLFSAESNVPAERLHLSTKDAYATGKPDLVSIATWPGLHESAVYRRKVHLANASKLPALELVQHKPEPLPVERHRVCLIADEHHKDDLTGNSTRDGLMAALQALPLDPSLVGGSG